jgi:hypothetical protein
MNGYGLVAAIFQSIASLAWPAAVLAGLWIYRDTLVKLLPLLTLKHKDWEASFRLERAEEEAAKLPEPPVTAEAGPTPEEISRFEQIAKLSPRGAILEVRANLEEAVRSFANAVGVPNKRPYVSYAGLIRTLRENGLIDQIHLVCLMICALLEMQPPIIGVIRPRTTLYASGR